MVIEKHLQRLDFLFDKNGLTIYQIKENKSGGYRESITLPRRNLYSLLVFIIRILRAKTK